MSGQINGSASADAGDRVVPDLRVIVVGRTALDHALRRDSTVEFIRVVSPLEAVGELASPIDPQSPARSAVLVSSRSRPSASAELVAALRLADPAAAVLIVGDEPPDGPGPFDGTLSDQANIDQLRAIVHARDPSARAASPLSPVTTGAASDRALVKALLEGQDPRPIALALLAQRIGVEPKALLIVPDGIDAPAAIGDVAVTHLGRVFGVLRGASAAVLGPHAGWLGDWLALADQQAALRRAALTDELTGAFNRRYFEQYMATAMEQSRQSRQPLTLMVFDIDGFKGFNDRFGHAAGDEILRESVRLLNSTIRPHDRVCRIGGDEFAVIFFDPTGPRDVGSKPLDTVTQIAQRFQQQVASHRFPKLGDCAPGTLTISGGLATYPWDGRTTVELLDRADQLALESKRAGKNALRFGPGVNTGD